MESEMAQSSSVAPILGEDAQLLITLNQKLSTLGIKDTIKLPTIVVLGDQSTGKSSTVEAISTISVPKASGLCTRCPISLSLSDAQNGWECSVYVEERYRYDPTVKQKRVSKANPLGPWKELREPTMTLIDKTQDRGNLVHLIQEAQDKILNPTGKQQSLGRASTQPEGFSPNIIRLELSIPDCAPLHFVDLPGVIASSGKDQPDYYVDLVKSLATIHAKDENNFILLTLPANHDTSNSNSYSIIQRHNAQSRTMAVFTKVDICRDEERDDVLRRYFGEGGDAEEEEEFEYGNHIVMLRDTAGSVERVKEAEKDFFSGPPWGTLNPTTRKCLGVAELSDRIRDILFKKTAESLPANLEQIRIRAAEIESELQAMPAPPDSTALPYELLKHMCKFETNMRQLFSSTSTGKHESPRSTLINCMSDFHTRLVSARPTVKVKTRSEVRSQQRAQQGANTESSGSGSTNTGEEDTNANTPSPAKTELTLNGTRNTTDIGPHCFHLESVRQMNNAYYSSSVPGDIELKAVCAMHCLAVGNWNLLFTQFMQEIKHTIKFEVTRCIETTLNSIVHLPAYQRIMEITENYLDLVIEEETRRLQTLCDSERSHPLTFNDASLRTAEAESLTFLRQKREESRLDVEKDVEKAKAAALKRRFKEPTAADIGPDPFDLEIRMVAKARAYFGVACHRFVDTVCLNIHAQLIPRCEAGLANYISEVLGLNNIDGNKASLVELMTEDGEREAQRRQKLNELERLNTGWTYIANVLNTLQRQSSGLPELANPDPNYIFYQNSHDDPFALRTDNVSPNKRKIAETGTEEDVGQFSTPTKRQRESTVQRVVPSNAGPSNSRMYLPSRPRSVDPDEQ